MTFTNILFGGPCNQRCPGCIGHLLHPRFCQDNLHEYPLRNQDAFGTLLRQHGVRQVVFPGTTTDPQLNEDEVRLMDWLRRQVPGVQISLHTNGQLAMDKMNIVKCSHPFTEDLQLFHAVPIDMGGKGCYHEATLGGTSFVLDAYNTHPEGALRRQTHGGHTTDLEKPEATLHPDGPGLPTLRPPIPVTPRRLPGMPPCGRRVCPATAHGGGLERANPIHPAADRSTERKELRPGLTETAPGGGLEPWPR